MEINANLTEKSDGKLYGLKDLVKAGCDDCKGCSACCQGMGDTIILDPYDVYRLEQGLHQNFEQLLAESIELHMQDGMILPNLKMQEETQRCAHLNEEGRCRIHEYRPGLCRLFPLGRAYVDDQVQYILLTDECQKENRSKVKVQKWLDMPDIQKYEQYLVDWHNFVKGVRERIKEEGDTDTARTLLVFLLQTFFQKEYEGEHDFYQQFYERLERIRPIIL